MTEVAFNNRKYNCQKLISYGFKEEDGSCFYEKEIAGGELLLTVKVTCEGRVFTRVTDTAFGEEYVLHLVGSAGGAFVGKVKAEYEAILGDISERAFDNLYFSSITAAEIMRYIKNRFDGDAEFLFDESPDCAVWRRKDNKKWYAVLMNIKAKKLGLDDESAIDVLNLKNTPENIDSLVSENGIFRGYHMNKKHWLTVALDGTVSMEKVFSLIDESYDIVEKKHKKARRKAE